LYSTYPLAAFLLELGFGLFCWWYYRGEKVLFWIILGFNLANISLFFPRDTGFGRLSRQPANGHHDAYFCADCCDACAGGWRAMRKQP